MMLKGKRKGMTETWYAFCPEQSLSISDLRGFPNDVVQNISIFVRKRQTR
jgi:hypothetical protein